MGNQALKQSMDQPVIRGNIIKKLSKILMLSILMLFFLVSMASADLIGYIGTGSSPITIYDGFEPAPGGEPYEDNEVEDGMMTGQAWDMEAIYWSESTSTLHMVAGYDFLGSGYTDGRAAGDSLWSAGDVFLFGSEFDYVLSFDRLLLSGYESRPVGNLDISGGVGTLDVYQADADLSLYQASGNQGVTWEKVYFEQNYPESNPYARKNNSQDDLISSNVAYGYSGAITGGIPGVASAWSGNDTHYVLSLDLSGIGIAAGNYTAHMTMECGNDVMRGDLTMPLGDTPVPEPATMLLFGTGLVGLAGFGRKTFLKKV